MASVAATMATPTRHHRFRVHAAWDMNPGAATVSMPKPSKAKAKPALPQSPATTTTPARAPPPTHEDLFARSSEGQAAKKSTYMGFEKWWLPPAPEVKKPRSLYNAASLAYLGDCIYELYARRHFFFPPLSINEYNKRVMDVVKCESQDLLLNKLLGEDFLTQEERDILRWGRNIVSSKTRTRKRAGIAVYNRASSLETLVREFLNCFVDARHELLQKFVFAQRSITLKKAMLSYTGRSSYDQLSLCEQARHLWKKNPYQDELGTVMSQFGIWLCWLSL